MNGADGVERLASGDLVGLISEAGDSGARQSAGRLRYEWYEHYPVGIVTPRDGITRRAISPGRWWHPRPAGRQLHQPARVAEGRQAE